MSTDPWTDMPHAIDANTGAFIPPPPGATFLGGTSPLVQGRTMNGTPYPHYAAHLPSPAPTPIHWPPPALPYPPWGTPVTSIHASAFGPSSPASYGPHTPMSPGYISPSPVTPLSYSPFMSGHPITPYVNTARGGALGLTSSPSLDPYGYPLSRTPSNGGKKKRNASHSRSPSVRNDYQLWKGPDQYSLKNLAKRPRDWRPDYTPRPGIVTSYISLTRHPSDVPEFTDPVKRTLNSLLLFKPAEQAMYWNLRLPPTLHNVDFTRLNREFNQIDLLQLATSPPADQMRLYHPKLPWYIDVFKRHPNGITIEDILNTIHAQLSTQIRPRHFYNEELDAVSRGVLQAAFSHRCANQRDVSERGLLQVDFLADKYVLLGLVKGKNGMWEMKTGDEDL